MKELELISREEAIKRVTESLDFVGSRDIDCAISAISAIQDTPQIPCIPRIESHWIRLVDIIRPNLVYSDLYKCANCSAEVHLGCVSTDCDYDFCPMCAAVMCSEAISACANA